MNNPPFAERLFYYLDWETGEVSGRGVIPSSMPEISLVEYAGEWASFELPESATQKPIIGQE